MNTKPCTTTAGTGIVTRDNLLSKYPLLKGLFCAARGKIWLVLSLFRATACGAISILGVSISRYGSQGLVVSYAGYAWRHTQRDAHPMPAGEHG